MLYRSSVALGDHSSPKPVYLISYGDPKPEQPATVIAVVSSKREGAVCGGAGKHSILRAGDPIRH